MMTPRQLMLPADLDAAVRGVAGEMQDRQEWSAAVRLLLREALDARRGRKVEPAATPSQDAGPWQKKSAVGSRLKAQAKPKAV